MSPHCDTDEAPRHSYDEIQEPNVVSRGFGKMYRMIDGPVTWFREKVVVPNRKFYPWYHQEFRRVPTIDECYQGDNVCFFEANEQFKRDKKVDNNILIILRRRYEDCAIEEFPGNMTLCKRLREEYEVAAADWFAKYGDLGYNGTVRDALMKQKHRLLWERRHGKVGTGMKNIPFQVDEADVEH